MNNIIDNFKNLKVLVIGDAILDTYIQGSIDRICREAPVPVVNVNEHIHSCGGAANTAINVATLGAETFYLSVLGKDVNGREVLDILRKHKVHTEYVLQDKNRKTIAKKRVTASSNIILRLDEGTVDAISETCEKELLETVFELYDEMDAIILSDYGFGLITDRFIASFKSLFGQGKKPVIVDSRNAARFKSLQPTAVKPNYEETVQLLQTAKVAKKKRIEQVVEHSKQLLEITGAKNIMVTLDSDGVMLLKKNAEPHHISCIPRDSKNTIGAGDTFISALALSFASGLDSKTSAELAAAAAAVVVQKDGTVGCTNNELKACFHAVPKFVSDITELAAIVKDLKKKGKRIVFTNGCFDIIHKGHIALLNKAREAGDVLIVGVNNDASVKKVKGAERPINTLEDRIIVLAGLQSVDYLTAFAEESPVNLIKAVHPDVFIKGGSYTEESIPEAPLLKKLHCEVKIIPYMKELSTSLIIRKIRDANDETGVNNIQKNILTQIE